MTTERVIQPQWDPSKATINSGEIVREGGSPTFQTLVVPPDGLMPIDCVVHENSQNGFSLSPELAAAKNDLIARRTQQLTQQYQEKLIAWDQNGKQGEKPEPTTFFDGTLTRVLLEETELITDSDQPHQLRLAHSSTSYFEYVATRSLPSKDYRDRETAAPLGACGVVTLFSDKNFNGSPEKGTEYREEYLLYAVRANKGETYKGFASLIGGMMTTTNPTGEWVEELQQEAGINPNEVLVVGTHGLVKDQHFRHIEMTHRARLMIPLEELFESESSGSVNLVPKRHTDKEVNLRAVRWEPEIIKDLILGQKNPNGDQDPRPWTPTHLANLLLSGKVDFGEEWYRETIEAYQTMIQGLRQ